jgi:hypothetical protein
MADVLNQNPTDGLPKVDPINQANYQVPNAAEIMQAANTLQNAHITVDQTGLSQLVNQQQDIATQQMGQLQNPQPGQSAAEIGTQRGIQSTAGQANAATQNSLAAAANPLAAQRTASNAAVQQNVQTAAVGAQARAQESSNIVQNAQSALASATQGTLSGASQRLQAEVATQNLVQQAIADRTQLAQMQLNASMNYAQLSMQYQQQQRNDYLTMKFAAIKNQQMVMGAIISTIAAVAQAGFNAYGQNEAIKAKAPKSPKIPGSAGSSGYNLPGLRTGADTVDTYDDESVEGD